MPSAIDFLRQKGLKVTSQRVAVLKVLLARSKPMVLSDLQDTLGHAINRVTLYRVLNLLEKENLIRLFYSLEGQKFVEAKAAHTPDYTTPPESHKHVHFQCRSCDHVFCLDDVLIKGLPEGFKLLIDKTVLAGLCKACK